MILVSEVDYRKLYCMKVSNEVQQITSPLTKYGITYFSFSRINKYREETYVTSRIDSIPIWFEGKFYETLFCDAIDKYFDVNVLWKDIAISNKSAAKIFNIYTEDLNIGNGLSLLRKYEEHVDHFYFAGERNNEFLNLFYLNNLDLFEKFIPYFYDKAQHLIKEAHKDRLYTPGCFDKTILTSDQIKTNTKIEKMNFMFNLFNFSEREKQCVTLLLAGNRTKTIASKLYISERTAEKHLQSAKQKAQCKTCCDLIIKLTN